MNVRCVPGVVLALCIAGPVSAGQVSGTIREGAKPAVGVRLLVTCGVERVDTFTDKRGRYRIHVLGSGRCRFEVPDRGASTFLELSDQPLRQDFSLSDRNLQAR